MMCGDVVVVEINGIPRVTCVVGENLGVTEDGIRVNIPSNTEVIVPALDTIKALKKEVLRYADAR